MCRCPICDSKLTLTYDLESKNKLVKEKFFNCPVGHGTGHSIYGKDHKGNFILSEFNWKTKSCLVSDERKCK